MSTKCISYTALAGQALSHVIAGCPSIAFIHHIRKIRIGIPNRTVLPRDRTLWFHLNAHADSIVQAAMLPPAGASSARFTHHRPVERSSRGSEPVCCSGQNRDRICSLLLPPSVYS